MDNIIIWFREKNMSIPKSALFHSYMDARDNILKMWLDDRLILVAVYELHLGYMKELKMVV